MTETNFDTYIKQLAFDLIKKSISIRISNGSGEEQTIKVQLLFDGEVFSESELQIPK